MLKAPNVTPDLAVRLAIADLAARLDVDPQAIRVVRVDNVVWRDGSLGCPRPGMFYTQALAPGLRIVLEADEKHFNYHAARGRPPFYCSHPSDESVETER